MRVCIRACGVRACERVCMCMHACVHATVCIMCIIICVYVFVHCWKLGGRGAGYWIQLLFFELLYMLAYHLQSTTLAITNKMLVPTWPL